MESPWNPPTGLPDGGKHPRKAPRDRDANEVARIFVRFPSLQEPAPELAGDVYGVVGSRPYGQARKLRQRLRETPRARDLEGSVRQSSERPDGWPTVAVHHADGTL